MNQFLTMRLRHGVAVLLGSALLLAACGGSSEVDSSGDGEVQSTTTTTVVEVTTTSSLASTTTSALPTSAATPTTATPIVEFTEAEAVGGLVTLTLPDNWVLSSAPPERLALDVGPLNPLERQPYAFDDERLDILIEFTNGNIEAGIMIDAQRYTTPDYAIWRGLVMAQAAEDGFSANLEFTLEWAGGRGDRAVGTLDGDFLQIDTVEAGDFKVMAIAGALSEPTDAGLDELKEILATVEIHPAAVPLLTHVTEANRSVTEEGTGSTPFSTSYYVPGDWELTDAESGRYEPTEGDGFIEIYLEFDTDGFERHVEAEFEDFAREFLEVESVRIELSDQPVQAVVFWAGEPGEAQSAVVMAADGVVFMSSYLFGDPALLVEIVESLVIFEHAFN